jgi:hypothetical protein
MARQSHDGCKKEGLVQQGKIGFFKKVLCTGLFKKAQMQGA